MAHNNVNKGNLWCN